MAEAEKNKTDTIYLILLSLSKGAGSRRKILISLCNGPKNCNQLSKETELDWWTVRKHLMVLSKENIIKAVPFGCSKFYKLTPVGEVIMKKLIK